MAEIMRSFDVCLFVCARSGRSWELNANSSKTVKATDFKFDTRVPRDSPDMTPKIFPKGGVFNNLLGGDIHSHECLLVFNVVSVLEWIKIINNYYNLVAYILDHLV